VAVSHALVGTSDPRLGLFPDYSGGDIQNSSLAGELGATGRWSDALDAALLISGVQAKVRVARFTSGTVALVQVADGTTVVTAPFSFSMKEIDLSYDFAPARGTLLKNLSLGFG
jgi:hypothetical protein